MVSTAWGLRWGLRESSRQLIRLVHDTNLFCFALILLHDIFISKEVLVHIRYLNRELNMEREFLGKVEDNATVRVWSEKVQQEKGDSLVEGYASELWDFTRISVTQNTYSCFTFGKIDLVPTVEEYTTLLRCPRIQVDKAYSRAAYVPTFLKKLMSITGMSEQWAAARIKQKGDSKCIHWKNLRDLILAHPDVRKRVDIFALSIYGLVVFPKALGRMDEAVSDLFDRFDKRVTPVPTILAETFRSLNACQRAGEGRFIGCAQLLLVWFYSHFWKVEKVSYRVFLENYSPLKELMATPRRDDITEEKWMRAIGYAPLLVSRQYRSRQFIQTTQGLAQCKFSYRGDNYKKKVRVISNAWNQTRRMKILADFEKRSLELGNKIEQLEEEKMCLGLDVDIHKLEAEKLKNEKNKAEEDLDSLKTDYKKLRLLIRTAGLGKTSEQWWQEIKEEKTKADQWEKKFQDARARESALVKNLLEC
ncbi:hypothetical protein Gogos_021793 [Gossypium gossypioides]|uniref:DUF7745 domain-containing protein n=2 Tax=Gossypium gossypioides TaxID=34282 RepID=A0A7J9D5U3_GOSGO|nr:hypothetical protein [Gossypium gossypioides]